MRVDRRTLKSAKDKRSTWFRNLEDKNSFLKSLQKERGIQPLCEKCVRRCKVLDASNSTFVCFGFKEKAQKTTIKKEMDKECKLL